MQILKYRTARMKLNPFDQPKLYHCYLVLVGLKKYTFVSGMNPIQASQFDGKIKVNLIQEKTGIRTPKLIDFKKIDFTQSIKTYEKIKKPTTKREERTAPNLSGEQSRLLYPLPSRII